MMPTIRSRTTRYLGALVGAVALTAMLPATAFADRDGRGGRHERHDDRGRGGHGHHDGRGRDHGRHHERGHHYAVHRHGPGCSHRPFYGYAYRPHHAQHGFYRYGWFFRR